MMAMDNAEEVMQILERFTRLKQKEIPKELDDYLGYVAKTGDTVFKWPTIKYLFREKLLNVIKHFHDTSPRIEEIPQYPNVDPFNYESMKSALLERLDLFNAAPFTIQRLCELLIDPRKQYSRIDKFMRALEKNILVVSTVEPGCNRAESENGDSLDSVVNGDLSLDVNVDVDMETESLFSLETTNGNSSAATMNKINLEITRKENKTKTSHAADEDISSQPKKPKLELELGEELKRNEEEKSVTNSSENHIELRGQDTENESTTTPDNTDVSNKEEQKNNDLLESRANETLEETVKSDIQEAKVLHEEEPNKLNDDFKTLEATNGKDDTVSQTDDKESAEAKQADTEVNKTDIASNFQSEKQENLTTNDEEKSDLNKELESENVEVKECGTNGKHETSKEEVQTDEPNKTKETVVVAEAFTKFSTDNINEEALKEDVTNAKIEYEQTEANKSQSTEINAENLHALQTSDLVTDLESAGKRETSDQALQENINIEKAVHAAPKTEISPVEVESDSKQIAEGDQVLKHTPEQVSISNEEKPIEEVKPTQPDFSDWLKQKSIASEVVGDNKGVEEVNAKISIQDALHAPTANSSAENPTETVRTDDVEMPKEIALAGVVAASIIAPAAAAAAAVPELAMNDQLMAVEDSSPVTDEVVMDELTSAGAEGRELATDNQTTADEAELNSAIRSIASDGNVLGITSPPTAMATDDEAITSVLTPTKINVDDSAGMEVDDTSQEEAMDQ